MIRGGDASVAPSLPTTSQWSPTAGPRYRRCCTGWSRLAPVTVTSPSETFPGTNAWRRMHELFCENLRRYAAGQPLLNVVDKSAGF